MTYENLNPHLYYIVRVSGMTAEKSKESYAPRCSRYHEIEWITQGEGTMIVNGEKQNVFEGDVLYRRPSTSVQAYGNYNCILLMFEPFISFGNPVKDVSSFHLSEHLGNGLTKLDIANFRSTDSESNDDLAFPDKMVIYNSLKHQKSMNQLVKTYSQYGENKSLECKIALLEVLNNLYEELKLQSILKGKGQNHFKHYKLVEEINGKIDQDPSIGYSLEGFAKMVGVSKYHLSRIYKDMTGLNISTYHKQARIDLAKHYLIATEKSVDVIAYQVGYETTTYFYRVFKNELGLTPNAYREQFLLKKHLEQGI